MCCHRRQYIKKENKYTSSTYSCQKQNKELSSLNKRNNFLEIRF